MAERGKVLPMVEEYAFFLKNARRHNEQDHLEQAAFYAVKAMRADGKKTEARMLLAQIWRQMGRFARSNDLLAGLLAEENADRAECFYLMGCNFADLQMLGAARDSFQKCIASEPTQEQKLDAEDMLEPLAEYYDGDEQDRMMWYLQQAVQRAKRLYASGNVSEAEEIFRRVDQIEPLFMDVRNYLSRCRWTLGARGEALALSRWVLENYSKDIIALCNLSVFLHRLGKTEECSYMLEQLSKLRFDRDMEAPDDLLEVAEAYYRCERYQEALRAVRHYRSMIPFEDKGMHLEAACLYMTGAYEQAQKLWTSMCRIDDLDFPAWYYRSLCVQMRKPGTVVLERIPAKHRMDKRARQAARTQFLKLTLRDSADTMTPEELRILYWMLQQEENVMELLLYLGQDKTDESRNLILARMMRDEVSDIMFQAICSSLQMHEGNCTSWACHDDKVFQIRLEKKRTVSRRNADLADVRTLLITASEGVLTRDQLKEVLQLLKTFSGSLKKWYPLSSAEAFAGALEYFYLIQNGQSCDKKLCIQRYATDVRSFNQALARITRVFSKQTEKQGGETDADTI